MSDTFPWEHMLERARTNSLLGKQLFVVFTMPENGMEPIQANIKEHLAYQRMLEDTGVMFAAGPMADMNGETWSGDGMVVIRAESLEDAKAIAAADPMHAAGARKYMVRPWIVNEGTMTVKVGFASGSRELI
ncbi:MAG: YciI family protein [Alphaproteobacteria bacterium]|jgi:uncharacterized protein